MLARVSRLGETGQRALELVALAGSRAEADLVDALLHDGLAALDEPLARGLLRRSGGDVLFRHELGRLAVLEEVPAGRAVHLHRRLLAALSERGADPARLAHHAEAAGDHAAVLRHARAAAASAAAYGSHREASRQYERALRHGDELAIDERAQLLWDLGYEYYLTNRIAEAIETVGRARALWDSLGDDLRVGDAWRCESRLQWFAGHNDDARAAADRAVELLDGTASVEQAMALSHRAGLSMLKNELAATRAWGERTLSVLDGLPDGAGADVRVHALNNLGSIEVIAGDLERGVDLLQQSLAAARSAELHEHAARAFCNLASTAVAQRRHADALRWLDEGLTYCTDRDLDSWTGYLRGWRSRLHLDRGEEAEARADATAVMRGGSNAVGSLEPLLVLAQLDARTGVGDPEEALARAVEMSEAMAEAQRIGPTTSVRCEAAWIAGDEDGDHRDRHCGLAARRGRSTARGTAAGGDLAARCDGCGDAAVGAVRPGARGSLGRGRRGVEGPRVAVRAGARARPQRPGRPADRGGAALRPAGRPRGRRAGQGDAGGVGRAGPAGHPGEPPPARPHAA